MIATLARKLLIASLAAVAFASAQTQVDLQHQARGIDFTAASYTKPIRMGSALPASCGVGEVFLLTSAPAGANVYMCLQANQWTPQTVSSTGALNYVAPPTGSVSRTLTSKLSDVVSVLDFGADPTGATSSTAAFTAAVASVSSKGGSVLIPGGGTYLLSTKWTIQQGNLNIEAAGAVITCAVASDDCIYIVASNNSQRSVMIQGATIQPGVQSTGAAIHDAGWAVTLDRVNLVSNATNYFYYGIQVDTDQEFVMRNSPLNSAVLLCNSTFCGSLIYNPPGSANAAVGYISDSYIDPECGGNGIDWDGGNDLHLSSVVIEAYSQFGLRDESTAIGADSRAVLNKVHNEAGNCTNPAGNVGNAGNILVGASLQSDLAQLGGAQPVFTVTNPGTTQYNYYVQPYNGAYWGGPLPIGYVSNGSSTINSSNTVALQWPTVPLATSYNIYRVPVATAGRVVPTMTGNWLVANVNQSGTGTQSYTDTVTSPTSVTPPIPFWSPQLPYWPGSVILSSGIPGNGFTNGQYFGPAAPGTTFVVATWYSPNPLVNLTPGSVYDFSTDVSAPSAYNSTGYQNGAAYLASPPLMLPLDAAAQTFSSPTRGVINTTTQGSNGGIVNVGPTDIFTLYDSGYTTTIGTLNKRALSAPGDTAICQDTAAGTGFCTRAAASISNYINALPDGASWLTRLTSSAFTSTVPITAPAEVSNGTTFTLAGCSANAPVGGASAGTFLSGTTGTCTVTITIAGATGVTAPNGWICTAQDWTTPSNVISQTASSTTTCSMSGNTASGDKIGFSARAY